MCRSRFPGATDTTDPTAMQGIVNYHYYSFGKLTVFVPAGDYLLGASLSLSCRYSENMAFIPPLCVLSTLTAARHVSLLMRC